jgi:hypothetical protein
MKKKILSLLLILMFFSMASCGSMMYKDRNFSEKSNRIDYFVLGLDSMGLFCFVAPGLLLLFVDYSTGALWLSKDEDSRYVEEGLEQPVIRDIVFD